METALESIVPNVACLLVDNHVVIKGKTVLWTRLLQVFCNFRFFAILKIRNY